MKHGPTVPRVYTNDLAISRKNKRLYITGTNSLDLFSIDLDKLRHKDRLSVVAHSKREITVEYSDILWHGIKLGTSTGLLCDSKDGVQYFLVSEHASVRWDTKYNLKVRNIIIYSLLLFVCLSQKKIERNTQNELPTMRTRII